MTVLFELVSLVTKEETLLLSINSFLWLGGGTNRTMLWNIMSEINFGQGSYYFFLYFREYLFQFLQKYKTKNLSLAIIQIVGKKNFRSNRLKVWIYNYAVNQNVACSLGVIVLENMRVEVDNECESSTYGLQLVWEAGQIQYLGCHTHSDRYRRRVVGCHTHSDR